MLYVAFSHTCIHFIQKSLRQFQELYWKKKTNNFIIGNLLYTKKKAYSMSLTTRLKHVCAECLKGDSPRPSFICFIQPTYFPKNYLLTGLTLFDLFWFISSKNWSFIITETAYKMPHSTDTEYVHMRTTSHRHHCILCLIFIESKLNRSNDFIHDYLFRIQLIIDIYQKWIALMIPLCHSF